MSVTSSVCEVFIRSGRIGMVTASSERLLLRLRLGLLLCSTLLPGLVSFLSHCLMFFHDRRKNAARGNHCWPLSSESLPSEFHTFLPR
ncbi:hypothetical protein XELAEV_18046473mg [Xenopus laevis]|uniref:Uncharacterized protein n=1 Tax=Xenopus laevis TaxID=8355 RepID=A0A974BT49_XENLA|nr:hypothetical protein XELAEV_18046473mg [Xenopus laevis]